MGHRANLIIREHGVDHLYYTHWRANTLDGDLFWGPAAALAFVRRQRPESEGAEWLDHVWAEGGAVLDVDRRTLLWFGGEDVKYEVPLRQPHDQSGLVREVGAHLALDGRGEGDVVVNPYALRDDPGPSPGADAARAFDEAVARWRERSA